jgi:hypothetical protein
MIWRMPIEQRHTDTDACAQLIAELAGCLICASPRPLAWASHTNCSTRFKLMVKDTWRSLTLVHRACR